MKKISILIVLGLSFFEALSQGNDINHIYRVISQNPNDKTTSSQTGFKINNKRGIYTALHGIASKLSSDGKINIMAIKYKPSSTIILETISNLEIKEIDISKDLVLLDSPDLNGNLSGINQAIKSDKDIKLKFKDKLTVVGFPETLLLKTSQVTVQGPPIISLKDLLIGGNDFDRFKIRASPAINQKIIQLGSNEIMPGHSGGPILDAEYRIIGVADGGRNNTIQNSISTWAIPFTGAEMKVYSKKDSKLLTTLMKIKSLYSADEIKEDIIEKPETHFYGAVNSPKKYPKLIFTLLWNRPATITTNGIAISTNLSDLNVGIDLSIDKQINKWFYLGLFTSSRYFQYKMLGKFKYNLPIEVSSYNFTKKEQIDSYGLQTSAIFLPGVLHHFYAGFGGFYAGENQINNNYRAFLGLRKYIFHRQHIAIDIKALYSSKNESIRIPTLGNSNLNIQPYNQYFLCLGLSYSFQKK